MEVPVRGLKIGLFRVILVVPSHCYGDHKYSPSSKLRQLGTPNGIVDDLDFKLFKFDRRLQCESDSKSTIAILI